jgi:hypothetical protein
MSIPPIPPNIRLELIANADVGRRRTSKFSPTRPTDWRPTTVVDPRDQEKRCFTDLTAWDFIVEILKKGCDVKVIELRQPAGKVGYEIIVPEHPNIYIKLQLFSPPGVIGRSFHYSEHIF